MNSKSPPSFEDPFATTRSSARRGYSSCSSDRSDDQFASPRATARSWSSDDTVSNTSSTPRDMMDYESRAIKAYAPAAQENDIFSAARHNHLDSVQYLLDNGVSVNSKDAYGNTLLAIACQNGLKRMAKLVLRNGANINSQNYRGNTALHFCFAYGYGDTLGEYLISKGADTTILNDDGMECYEGIKLSSVSRR